MKFTKLFTLGICTLIYLSSTALANSVYIDLYKNQHPKESVKSIEDKIQAQRQAYLEAKEAILNGDLIKAQSIKNQKLKDYPLNIWLDYYYLSRDIDDYKFNDALNFIQEGKQHELGNLLKNKYINFYAQRQDFQKVEALLKNRPYDPKGKLTSFQKGKLCQFYEAKWHTNKASSEAVSFATKLFLDLRSKPQECNGLLSLLDINGYLTDAIRIKKIESAYVQKSYKNTLVSLIDSISNNGLKQRALAYMALYEHPENLFELVPNTTNANRRVAVLAFKRWANLNTDDAVSMLDEFIKTYKPTDVETISIYQIIANNLLNRGTTIENIKWVDNNLPVIAWNEDIIIQRLRRAIWFAQWDVVNVLYDYLPEQQKASIDWRYFKARALKELKQKKEANKLYAEVSKDRSFWGFLAAQESGHKMAYNHRKINKKLKFPNDLKNNSAAIRYFELDALGDNNAIYEWREVAKYGTEDEAFLMAEWALSQDKFGLAIDSVVSSKRWDALDYRFPIAYLNIYDNKSEMFDVPLSFIYGISRQESMLNASIKSPVGAVGLMQLMPGTAQQMAKRHQVNYKNARDLVKPELNVTLGTAYLRYLMDKFDNNRILVAVGYNAGPGRVYRWASKDGIKRDVAQYVANIPFKETRGYVQNVILYDAIYHKLLHNKEKNLLTPDEMNYSY